jgi:hypothetical protein
MSKRKSLLSDEQEKLLERFQNTSKDLKPLDSNQNQKASSSTQKPKIRRSGSRGK